MAFDFENTGLLLFRWYVVLNTEFMNGHVSITAIITSQLGIHK